MRCMHIHVALQRNSNRLSCRFCAKVRPGIQPSQSLGIFLSLPHLWASLRHCEENALTTKIHVMGETLSSPQGTTRRHRRRRVSNADYVGKA